MEMSDRLGNRNRGDRNAGVHCEFSEPEGKSEKELSRLAKLAAKSFGTTSVAVSFHDEQGQWRIVHTGVVQEDVPFVATFCSETLAMEETTVVEDAQVDPRFADSPFVTLGPRIRFFASTPIVDAEHHCIGSVCVFDSEPGRYISDENITLFEDCALLASRLIALHRQWHLGEIAAKLVQASPEAVVAADSTGKIVYWNAGAVRMFGHPASQAIGQDVSIIIPDNLKERHKQHYRAAIGGAPTRHVGSFVEFEARHAQGHHLPVELSLSPWGDAERQRGFAAVIRDISDRKALERESERISSFLDTVIQNLPAMLFVKDAQTRKYLLVNRKAEALIGRTEASMLGHSDSELFPGIGEDYERRDEQAASSSEPTIFESEFIRDDGETRHLRTKRIVIDGPDRPRQFLLGLSEDTTEMRKVEDENRRLARYDSLTGLLNRASFFGHVRELVALSRPFALLSIDLDRFKAVNNQFGHPAADQVLKEIARRIDGLQNESTAARIGGDEFVIVLTGSDLRKRAAAFGERLIESISEPVNVGGKIAHSGISVGIALHPDDSDTIESLRECSDLALYRAKDEGRGKVCFFDRKMDEAVRKQKKLEIALRSAIENEDIFLRYQPIICARTGEMTSVEALARWELEGHGTVPPDVFIPLAEECGLIEDLGRQLLHRACTDAGLWRSDLRVAVNLSPAQFRSGKIITTVREALARSGLAPSRLLLEVTERLVIKEPEQAFLQLEELRNLGIQILMDDFGVGHSSLSYFQKFPFDKIKIDKSFTDEIEISHAAKSIVGAVVGLGRSLSMDIVAEGVETQEQKELLTALGCSHLQGYLFSRPVDPLSVAEFDLGAERGE